MTETKTIVENSREITWSKQVMLGFIFVATILAIVFTYQMACLVNFKAYSNITIMKHDMELVEKHKAEKEVFVTELKNRDEVVEKQSQLIAGYEKLLEAQKESLKLYREKDQERKEANKDLLEAQRKSLKISRELEIAQSNFIAFQKDRIKDMELRIKRQSDGLDAFEQRHASDLDTINFYKKEFDKIDREYYMDRLIGVLENPEKLYQHTLEQVQRIRFIQVLLGEKMPNAKD